MLAKPAIQKRLGELGATTLGGTRDQLRKHLADETAKWGKIIKEANIPLQ
ncbi:MAG: hypothetical protein LC129_09745 [Burkholderiales bacterium]|nr:hypothetical protein [Burkholderiales bacterium]